MVIAYIDGDIMKPNWILIANATQARLFQHEGDGPIVLIASFSHPEGRSKISELADDRAGNERSDRSYGGAAYEPRMDAKRKEHERFAVELAEYLEQAALQNTFASLVIFSSSPFLGEVKAHLGDATQKLVSGAHDVDLTSVGVTELKRRIAHELAQ
jgi:protein required for attachment to host cells